MLFLAFLLSRVITNLQNYDLKTQITKNVSCFWNVGETLKTIEGRVNLIFNLTCQNESRYRECYKFPSTVLTKLPIHQNSYNLSWSDGICEETHSSQMADASNHKWSFVHIVFKHCYWWQSDESMLVNVSFSDTIILQESRNTFFIWLYSIYLHQRRDQNSPAVIITG